MEQFLGKVLQNANSLRLSCIYIVCFQDLIIQGHHVETGEALDDMSVKVSHTFPLTSATISSLFCVPRKDKSVVCQLLLSSDDYAIIFAHSTGKMDSYLVNTILLLLLFIPIVINKNNKVCEDVKLYSVNIIVCLLYTSRCV